MPIIPELPREGVRSAHPRQQAAVKSASAKGITGRWKELKASQYWTFLKWSIMAVTLFWLLVYHLSDSAGKLPDFVYVNF